MNNETMTASEVKALTVDQIFQVYSGKPGCACGCRGTYRIHPLYVAYADKDRGYAHEAEDVNLAQVRKVLRIVQEHFVDGIEDDRKQCSIRGEFASVTIETGYEKFRVYTVYIKK